MTEYRVVLKNGPACALIGLSADDLDQAFAQALALDPAQLEFDAFTVLRPNEITVRDPEGNEWIWRDDDLLLREAADELLLAAKNIFTALQCRLRVMAGERVVAIARRHPADGRGRKS